MTGILYSMPEGGTRTFSRRENGRWYAPVSKGMRDREAGRVLQMGADLGIDTSRHLLAIAEGQETCSGYNPPAGQALGYVIDGDIQIFSEDHRIGWLSPCGMRFIPCASHDHDALARILDEKGTLGLEQKGWCRVTATDELWGYGNEATDAQARWLLKEAS